MVENHTISFSTKGNIDIIDISSYLNDILHKTGLRDGQLFLFVMGSTAALTTIEYEPGLVKDMKEFYSKLFPYDARYHHHETWNDDNGSSHMQASLLGPSISVPLVGGSLLLGTWQQVIFVDFDTRARQRKLHCQIIGE